MKKLLAILLSLVMVLGLVACGAEETQSEVEEEAGKSSASGARRAAL